VTKSPVGRIAVALMRIRILKLAPQELTLFALRRRVRGEGGDTLRLGFIGEAVSVSPTFGCALESLALDGAILVTRRRGTVRILPGRYYSEYVSPAQQIATATRTSLAASVPANSSVQGVQGAR